MKKCSRNMRGEASGTIFIALLMLVIILGVVFVSFMSDFQRARTIYQYYIDTRSTQSMEALKQLYVPVAADYSVIKYETEVASTGGIEPGLASSHGVSLVAVSNPQRQGGTPSSVPSGIPYWGVWQGSLKPLPPLVYDDSSFPVRLKPGESVTYTVPSDYQIDAKSVLVSLVFINESYTAELSTSKESVTARESWSYVLSMEDCTDSLKISVPSSSWDKPVVIVERVFFSPYDKDFLLHLEDGLQEKLEEYRESYSAGYNDVVVDPGEEGSWRVMLSPTEDDFVERVVFLKKGVVFEAGARTGFVSTNASREAYQEHEIHAPYYTLYERGLEILYGWDSLVRQKVLESVNTLPDHIEGKSDSWGCSVPDPYPAETLFYKREGLDWGTENNLKYSLTDRIVAGLDTAEQALQTQDVGVELYLANDLEPHPDTGTFWTNTRYEVKKSTGPCCECVACGCGTICGGHCMVYTFTSEYDYRAKYRVLVHLYYKGGDPEVVGDDTSLWFGVEDAFIENTISVGKGISEDHCDEVSCGNCPPCPDE